MATLHSSHTFPPQPVSKITFFRSLGWACNCFKIEHQLLLRKAQALLQALQQTIWLASMTVH
ncbi:hypothetical protein EAW55_09770 [Legionella jordanis]|nr:hypothetical protein EAW55_09770 [Legionella jordanis]RMX21633.1 hypothetical protein EAS68_02425 [Legionella jordanis]